jgi:hypothetical protein
MAIITEGSGEPHNGPAGGRSGSSPAAGARGAPVGREGSGEPQGGAPENRDRETPVRTTFDSTSPATGEVVGSFPVDGPEQVAAAVARAREGQRAWAELGFEGPSGRSSTPWPPATRWCSSRAS